MINSFAMMLAGSHRHAITANASRAASFPGKCGFVRCNFWHFRVRRNPLGSAIVEPRMRIKCGPRFDISHSASGETFKMTLTVAHISPIMSVIAGLLILIMPRLLNLVVAIFLILNGLIGLGLFRWLHI
jgi:hypothetical protein